jgi:hypothetical protein
MSKFDYVSLDTIKRLSKGHFFDKGSTRFFNSRYCRDGFRGMTKDFTFSNLIFFVTSEQYDHKSPRLYTIRRLNTESGEIITVGEFQGYKTSTTANKHAQKMAMESI